MKYQTCVLAFFKGIFTSPLVCRYMSSCVPLSQVWTSKIILTNIWHYFICAYFQIRGVCEESGSPRGETEGVLYDRRQRGENPGASGALHRSGQE